MNFELISQITLIFSGLGILTLIFKKIPILSKIPETKILEKEEESFILKFKRRIKELPPFKNFSYEIFLQKAIAKIRILTLKTDNQTLSWLQKLRDKTKNKFKKGSNYWEEIKRAKENK